MVKAFENFEIWFVTGAQLLYGGDAVVQVDNHSKEMVAGKSVTLAGWVQRVRKMGGMVFVDLRDRYGITQLVFNEADNSELCGRAGKLGREYCIQVIGEVSERQSKNANIPTGDIEILVKELNILSESATPPFTIEDNTDGGDDIRMKY